MVAGPRERLRRVFIVGFMGAGKTSVGECLARLLVKEEGVNPTGSFKARGLSAAVTRAVLAGARRFVVPTAGNAGVALAAYAARAGVTARVYAPRGTPPVLLALSEPPVTPVP